MWWTGADTAANSDGGLQRTVANSDGRLRQTDADTAANSDTGAGANVNFMTRVTIFT